MKTSNGAIETGGAVWEVHADGAVIETAEGMENDANLRRLVGLQVQRFEICSPDHGVLHLEGALRLSLKNSARSDYPMGAEMLTVFRDAPERSEVCKIQAPLAADDLHWEDAKESAGWFVLKAPRNAAPS